MRSWCALLLLAVLALFLASCNNDNCQTCPQDNTARITVIIRPLVLGQGFTDTLRLDSALVSIDGGPTGKVLPDKQVVYDNLSQGRHSVYVERWYRHFPPTGLVEKRTTTVAIDLIQGERRTLDIHDNFPRFTWNPARLDRALARWALRPMARWASA